MKKCKSLRQEPRGGDVQKVEQVMNTSFYREQEKKQILSVYNWVSCYNTLDDQTGFILIMSN